MNGPNEPIEFTRGDAERLARMEQSQESVHTKLERIFSYFKKTDTRYDTLKETVDSNARFRRVVVRVFVWIFTTSAGLGLIAAGAKAMGWVN